MFRVFLFFLTVLAAALPASGASMPGPEGRTPHEAAWRIRIHEAAAVPGETVRLGDIGEVYGTPPPGVWEKLAARPLWPAPPEAGKPLQINRVRLGKALRQALGEAADLCLLPSGMAIQRGGRVLREDDLRAVVVKDLTPQLRMLDGEAELTDFRLPPYAFLAHEGQRVRLEPVNPEPGRLSLRFAVLEVDGSPVRRFTGTVMLNVWKNVACAARPLNRGDLLTPEDVIWMRRNLVQLRGELWDGRGGPWQMLRSVGTEQPLYVTDFEPMAMIRKGAVITLLYNRGNVRLSVQAEALADGGPGATIAVRNLQSKKTVYAVVRDPDTVEVK